PVVADALLAAVAATLAWSFRDSLRLTGDFALRVHSLETKLDLKQLFPQAFPLDVALHLQFPRRLMALGLTADDALAAIGAVMAALFAVGCARFCRGLGARGAGLALGVLLLLAGGWLPHFAGYDKFGPVLVGFAFAASGLVRLWRGTGDGGELGAGLLLAAAD